MLRCILVLTLVATTWAQQQNRCKGFHLLSTSNESPSNVGDEVAFASTVLPGFVDSERSATLKLKFVRFQPRTWSRYLFNSAFSRNVDAKISLYSGREEKLYEREMTILEREDVTYEQFNTDDVDLRMSVARLDSKISYMTVAKLRDSCGRGFWMTYVVSLVLNQETYDGAVLAQLDLSYGAKLHQSLAAPLVLFQALKTDQLPVELGMFHQVKSVDGLPIFVPIIRGLKAFTSRKDAQESQSAVESTVRLLPTDLFRNGVWESYENQLDFGISQLLHLNRNDPSSFTAKVYLVKLELGETQSNRILIQQFSIDSLMSGAQSLKRGFWQRITGRWFFEAKPLPTPLFPFEVEVSGSAALLPAHSPSASDPDVFFSLKLPQLDDSNNLQDGWYALNVLITRPKKTAASPVVMNVYSGAFAIRTSLSERNVEEGGSVYSGDDILSSTADFDDEISPLPTLASINDEAFSKWQIYPDSEPDNIEDMDATPVTGRNIVRGTFNGVGGFAKHGVGLAGGGLKNIGRFISRRSGRPIDDGVSD